MSLQVLKISLNKVWKFYNLKKLYLTRGIIVLHILDQQKKVLKAIEQNSMTKFDDIINKGLLKGQKSLTLSSIEPAFDISRLNN